MRRGLRKLPAWLSDASPMLADVLSATQGSAPPPLRAEVFGLERFAQHGYLLGDTHRGATVRSGNPTFFPRLRDNIRALRCAHRYIGHATSTDEDSSPAAEWLLDNFHLIEAQLEEIQAALPRRYFHALPVMQSGPLAGLPRVYGVAWAFVEHTDSAFDEGLLLHFLAAYQQTCELQLGELWALPTTLRVVLVENLRRLAERVATNKAECEIANACADRWERLTPDLLQELLSALSQHGLGNVFLAQVAQRVFEPAHDLAVHGPAQKWLHAALPDPASQQSQHRNDQTADNLSVSNAVTSLRAIGDTQWADVVAHTSVLSRLMLTSTVFAAEHATTRDQSLRCIESLAKRCWRDEVEVAQTLLELMQTQVQVQAQEQIHSLAQGAPGPGPLRNHPTQAPSYWLQGAGRPALLQALGLSPRWHRLRHVPWRTLGPPFALPLYLGVLTLLCVLILQWLLRLQPGPEAGLIWWPVVIFLLALPTSQAVVAVINRIISESAQPSVLPRWAMDSGIPVEHRVLVVIPCMLTSIADVDELTHRLRLHHLANPQVHAQFALLSDWADAATAHLESDAPLLDHAVTRIQELNRLHPTQPTHEATDAPHFIVLHRARSFSDSEQRWIGWERKRGKLEQLIKAMATSSDLGSPQGQTSAFMNLGLFSRLAPHTPYIVTLDSDTELPAGCLHALVGVAAHPVNYPVVDLAKRRVTSGYGILQPHVATPLPSPQHRTPFHWVFFGQCGIDPYSAASSEVYQDVFGEGSFSGKGLLHVGAMHQVLTGRLPDGQVLSHDLLEGSMVRCAAVSSITLVEEAPFHADVAALRVHRWMRGDWQLLPFLLRPSKYGLRAIHCWKLLDNLRRSVVAPAALLLLIAALCGQILPPLAALLLVLAAFACGPLMGALAGLSPSRDEIDKRHFYTEGLSDVARAVLGGVWNLTQLLQQAGMAADAIARSLYRMGVSRRHLLQWTTTSAAQSQVHTTLPGVVRHHAATSLVAMVLLVILLGMNTPHPLWSLALCSLWWLSPVALWWISRPASPGACDVEVTPAMRDQLGAVARDTWRYFEFTVTAADNHLPPDNFQTDPHDMLARRTSPTNIGLYLLSAQCARSFGWIDTSNLLARLEATLTTVEGMQGYRGHLFNWYNTENALPLLPMYVSTVDSGNLCAHLLAVAQGCLELARHPDEAPFAPRLHAMALRCERFANQADFKFLYHPRRHLLHIGYQVAEQQLDTSMYDLLASESRLTSLFAIAKGDIPAAHWAALGRPFFAVAGQPGLRSWSGSMFEYLMPTLMLSEPHGSVLHKACHSALIEQMQFGQGRNVPWGMSESAYAERDHTLAYQYAPQGVPRLSLRRTPTKVLVVAPYATALAAQIDPQAACENFTALQALTPRHRYGFIDALDFTAARQLSPDPDRRFTPVSTFMAHHQGMTLVALANVLLDGLVQRWGMANPQIQAVSSLLHERPPREVPMPVMECADSVVPPQNRILSMHRQVTPGAAAVGPTCVLSNGRYSVLLRANGAGSSRWRHAGITRTRDDVLRDTYGSFFYWRYTDPPGAGSALPTLPMHSLTHHPAPDPKAHYDCRFHADRVSFIARWPTLSAQTKVWISPEDDIEFRQVELTNHTDQVLTLELISAFEITLAPAHADEAHPAFSNLFLSCIWRASQQALVFTRTPRLATEQALHAAHFVMHDDPQVLGLSYQTDRHHWMGRNRAPHQPQGQLQRLPLPASTQTSDADKSIDTGLDPVCALAVELRIEPHGKVQLTFGTAACDNGGTLHAVIDKYRQPSHVQRASLMSSTLAGIGFRNSELTPELFACIQLLTTAMVQNLTKVLVPPGIPTLSPSLPLPVCDRRLLWRFGLSGERPMVLVHISIAQGLGLVRSLTRALRLWARGGIACDLVVVSHEINSYQLPLQHALAALRARHSDDTQGESSPGGPSTTGFYLLRIHELSPADLSTLSTLARLQFQADGRPLSRHVHDWMALHEAALTQRSLSSTLLVGCGAVVGKKMMAQASGQFAPDSGNFVFNVSGNLRPLKPWINVLANPQFGAQVSETGAGPTWARNSRLMQLTAWSNDPVADTASEWLVLQDQATGQAWSAAPSAWGDTRLNYRVTHGQGVTSIHHRRGNVDVTVSWCVDVECSVKQLCVHLVNRGQQLEQLRLVGLVEWMMGASRTDRHAVRTALYSQRLGAAIATPQTQASGTKKLTALMCTQLEHGGGFGGATAFFATVQGADTARHSALQALDWTCDRREFFDARGRLVLPDHLGQNQGANQDPCAALAVSLRLEPGDAVDQIFLLGYGDSLEDAKAVAARAGSASPRQRLDQIHQQWDTLLGATTVATPDPLFDALVNRWLIYQTVSSRLWAKAGFYQAGGATGFRDQLQDTMALVWAQPAMLRAQIVLCASRQFAPGDVQHWWHEPGGSGVRTHFSDDLLWLPHACAHYVRATADQSVLDESLAFIEGDPIPAGAEDLYNTPTVGAEQASVYEHAARCIDHSLQVGRHGLPLMGGGDWNDGMNRVGVGGQGESVWLGWFLCRVVAEFGPIARQRGQATRAQVWDEAAAGWKAALLGPAWDGAWFKRAFFDNGQALGSHANPEAQIDLIAQAWSVLSNVAPAGMQRASMVAVQDILVDNDAGLIRLLHPPLKDAQPNAGYIQAYPPGVRENGGQYNHAAVWALMAQAQLAVYVPASGVYGKVPNAMPNDVLNDVPNGTQPMPPPGGGHHGCALPHVHVDQPGASRGPSYPRYLIRP